METLWITSAFELLTKGQPLWHLQFALVVMLKYLLHYYLRPTLIISSLSFRFSLMKGQKQEIIFELYT